MKKLLLFITILGCIGCTDAEWGKYRVYGSNATIRCWSGGQLILDEVSSGKILSEKNSNGYYFVSKKTGEMIEVDADCVFVYKKD